MEHAVQFGAYQHLSGIFNDAQHNAASDSDTLEKREPGDIAVIMVTPGMLGHAGPFRLHVDLAKSLAASGFSSFRFDLSGIGESFGIGAAGQSLDRAVHEIQTAMDWLNEHHSIQKVILFGLCSGADDGLATATADLRVMGLVSMDGCGYRTPGYRWHRLTGHYFPRVFSLRKWQNLLRRQFGHTESIPSSLQPGADLREFPSRDEAAAQISHLADQGTQFHFLYTSGVSEYYNHTQQFGKMFPELASSTRVTSDYWPDLDHVAFLCEDRQRLVKHITNQVNRMKLQITTRSNQQVINY